MLGGAELFTLAKARETEEAEIEREIEALRIARRVFDGAVKEGENFVWLAKRRLTDAVADVIRTETDITRLIAKAEAAQGEALAHRSALAQLASAASPRRGEVGHWPVSFAAVGVGQFRKPSGGAGHKRGARCADARSRYNVR